jgi:peptidoglycan glycosyltransferase
VTRQIRQLGIGLMVCFLVLFVQLNRLSIVDAKKLNDNPDNTREILRDFNEPRGTISTADGKVIAQSVPSGDTRFALQRQYPEGPLYAPITGYFSFTLGSAGVEKAYNDDLAGRTLDLSLRDIGDLFVDRERVGNVTLTIRDDLQRLASDQLAKTGRRGAVVAMDPRTGAILAMVANPTYDPNQLADHDTNAAAAAKTALSSGPAAEQGILSHAFQFRNRFFPGSTFKVVTATAALESGTITPDEPRYPELTELPLPTTNNPIENFADRSGRPERCGGSLAEVLRVSCNTAFAQMGLDTGAEDLRKTAERFGFNESIPFDLPGGVTSVFPTNLTSKNIPALAQSAIGQFDVTATPLQMALVVGAVANDGMVMKPHVLQDVRDSDGKVVHTYDPDEWRRAMDERTAATLQDAMIGVVTGPGGTGHAMAIPGFRVGGKTGTAQLGLEQLQTNAWMIGFAGPEGQKPEIVVAVLVEPQGQSGHSETGGVLAAPIAKAVLQAYLQGGRAG